MVNSSNSSEEDNPCLLIKFFWSVPSHQIWVGKFGNNRESDQADLYHTCPECESRTGNPSGVSALGLCTDANTGARFKR